VKRAVLPADAGPCAAPAAGGATGFRPEAAFDRGMGRRLPVAIAVALVAAAWLGAGLATGASTGAAGTPVAGPAQNLSVTISWNGVDVGQAGSASSAFVVGAGQTVDVAFHVNGTSGGDVATSAQLVLLYLGLTLSTEAIATNGPEPAGGWQLNWTFGSMIYITQGVYEVDAQLLDPNGSALFHEPFYVDARAPYLLGSAILSMAVILGIAELLWIRTVLRYRRSHRGRYRFR